MAKFQIIETNVYEVEAEDVDEARRKFEEDLAKCVDTSNAVLPALG